MSRSHIASALLALAVSVQAAEVKSGVAASNIHTVTFPSESLGEDRHFNVLLPEGYETSTRRYPVLYLLHGFGDDNTGWSYMSNLSAYGARHETIIVMPDGSKSWYVNNAANPKEKFEDYIVKDLISYADSHYRTLPLPRSRAVAGLSMGGYGALFLGLHHFAEFAAIGSFSGAVAFAHDPPLQGGDKAGMDAIMSHFGPEGSPERAARDPFTLIDKVPAAEMPVLYIACGGEDFLVAQNREFVALLASKKIPYEYREISPRVHSWDFWDDQIRVFLDKLDALPGFAQP